VRSRCQPRILRPIQQADSTQCTSTYRLGRFGRRFYKEALFIENDLSVVAVVLSLELPLFISL
jgi:hypothetical protein